MNGVGGEVRSSCTPFWMVSDTQGETPIRNQRGRAARMAS